MRGYQKKVIFLKNTGSHLFDEAYFVVSRQGEEAEIGQSNMILEANRIIRESIGEDEHRGRRDRSKIKNFLLPFFLGALISTALSLILYTVFRFL